MSYRRNYVVKAHKLLYELFNDFDEKRYELLIKLLGVDDASIYVDVINCPKDFLKCMKRRLSSKDYIQFEQIWNEIEKI